jgi:hypothetical protein
MTGMLRLLLAAAILAAPSAAAADGGPKTIVQTNKTWVCSSAVELTSVTVTMTPAASGTGDARDAVHLQPGCTGTIGRIDITTSVADGIKVAAGVHDLVVGGGKIRCLAKSPVLHQDGIQVLGGDRITFKGMDVSCGRPDASLVNSNMFINMAGRSTTPPTDVVCDSCTFGGDAAHTVLVQNSIRSGVLNSTLCRAKYPNLTLTIGSAAVDPVNTGNTLVDCSSSAGGGGGGGGSTGTNKLSLAAKLSAVDFGRPVVLTGSFGKAKLGRNVTMYAKPFGATAFTPVTTVKTNAQGGWQLTVHPKIATSYRAVSRASTSPTIAVRVRPLVRVTPRRGRVTVHVTARRPYRGATVALQERSGPRWVVVDRLKLGAGSKATAAVDGGRVRAVVGARPGYLPAVSPSVQVRS